MPESNFRDLPTLIPQDPATFLDRLKLFIELHAGLVTPTMVLKRIREMGALPQVPADPAQYTIYNIHVTPMEEMSKTAYKDVTGLRAALLGLNAEGNQVELPAMWGNVLFSRLP